MCKGVNILSKIEIVFFVDMYINNTTKPAYFLSCFSITTMAATSYLDQVDAAVRGVTSLKHEELMDYKYHTHGTYSCMACRALTDEYHELPAGSSLLLHPKFFGVRVWYDDYQGCDFVETIGCKRCMNESLLDFGSDLELEDTDRDQHFSRTSNNQRLHYSHHGSHKHSKASKKNRPSPRNQKYGKNFDVTVV